MSTTLTTRNTFTAQVRKAADLVDALVGMGHHVIAIDADTTRNIRVHVYRMLLCEEQVQRLCLVAGLDHRVDPARRNRGVHDEEMYDFGGVEVFTLVDPPPAYLVDRITTAIDHEVIVDAAAHQPIRLARTERVEVQEPCSNHACQTTDHDGLDPWGLCGPCVEDALARAEDDR